MSGMIVRPMRRAELDIAIEWAAGEGWNPGLADADAFYAADPGGFLVGLVDGKPAAVISVVAYGAGFGFLGFYIVHPDYRGRGHGLDIWNAGIARLGARTIGLDGVVAQQPNYRRSGFELAHRNIRYGGTPAVTASADPSLLELGDDAPPSLLDAVVAYDRPFFAGPREEFLRRWIEPPHRHAAVCLADRALRGYGVVRECRSGYKIGPLFADDPAIAEALFATLAAKAEAAPVFLDVPEPNVEARALAERHGLAPVFETARMYRGKTPDLPLERTYGIATFELG